MRLTLLSGKIYMEQRLLGNYGLLEMNARGPLPEYWHRSEKNLKELGINLSQQEFYKINSHGLRSEEFKKDHDGKHIVFAGCSNTFGIGSRLEDIWAHKLYKRISKEEKVSGYFNIGSPGATISEVSYQIFVYCQKYGYPDVVFINFPNYYREYLVILDMYSEKFIPDEITLNKKMITNNVVVQYLSLLENLKANGTAVVAMTWDMMKDSTTNELDARDSFPDLIRIDRDELAEYCLAYEKENRNNTLKKYFLVGLDNDHPGIAVHDFWHGKMYNRYKEIVNE